MSNNQTEAFWKVLKTIETATYLNLEDGSVQNMINNFNNMYYSKQYSDVLNAAYQERVKQLTNN